MTKIKPLTLMTEDELLAESMRLKRLMAEEIDVSLAQYIGGRGRLSDRERAGYSREFHAELERSTARSLPWMLAFVLISIPAVIAAAVYFGR